MAIIRPILKSVKASIDSESILESLKDVGYALRNNQPQVAIATMRTILTKFPAVKSNNLKMINTITSVREGIENGDLSATRGQKEIMDAFAEYDFGVRLLVTREEAPSQKDESEAIDKALARDAQVLKPFELNRNELEKAVLSRGIVTAYAPILAIASPLLDVVKLKANAFNATSFEGYPILHKQLVLGISHDRLAEEIDPSIKGKKRGSSALPGSSPEQREDVYARLREAFETKHRPLDLIQIGGSHHWYNTTWFWYIPQKTYKHLLGCTISPNRVQSIHFKKWTFPFSAQ